MTEKTQAYEIDVSLACSSHMFAAALIRLKSNQRKERDVR